MTNTAQCAKCAYKIDLPHADFVKMFYEQHNCEATKLQEAIARVRELHYREIDTSDYHCAECSDTEYGHYIDYPCNTIKAIDGEQ